MHLEQLSFLPTLDDAEHASWLLNGKQGVQNDCCAWIEYETKKVCKNYEEADETQTTAQKCKGR